MFAFCGFSSYQLKRNTPIAAITTPAMSKALGAKLPYLIYNAVVDTYPRINAATVIGTMNAKILRAFSVALLIIS